MPENPHIKFQYTVSPSDIGTNWIADVWKGPFEQTQLGEFVGFQEVGIKSAHTNILRYYDILMQKWMETFEIYDAREKEVIHVTNVQYGTPERLFSIDKKDGKGSMTSRLLLPAINYRRTGMQRRFDRGPTLRDSKRLYGATDDVFQNFIEIKSTYHLIDLTYQIDFWTKYVSEMQMLVEQTLMPFGPHAYFELIVPDIGFDEYIMMKLTDINDTSQLEVGDGERIIRATANVTLEAYVPMNVSKIAKSIKNIATEKAAVSYDYNHEALQRNVAGQEYVEHTESPAATTWTIVHGLGTYPSSIAVTDENNDPVVAYSVTQIDANSLRLTFAAPTAGTAILLAPITRNS